MAQRFRVAKPPDSSAAAPGVWLDAGTSAAKFCGNASSAADGNCAEMLSELDVESHEALVDIYDSLLDGTHEDNVHCWTEVPLRWTA